MIRTVWLATICLAALSALAAGKALRTPADSAVAKQRPDQTTIATGFAQDILKKADRLEVTYGREQPVPQTAMLPSKTFVPAISSSTLPIETKIIARHWHDPNAISSVGRSKQRKQTVLKKNRSADQFRTQQ